MTRYRASDLRAISGLTASAASSRLSILNKSAVGPFDVFLSHSFLDADVVFGLVQLLEAEKLTVYVDWIVDKQLDRSKVSADTASHLRRRMRSCKSMVYATSANASTSRWMPWELGYFDGIHGPERVAICPIDDGASGAVDGEEYLGLYKALEQKRGTTTGRLRPFVGTQTVRSFAVARV